MKSSFEHLPQAKRKKILLICDDIRVHSGVATVAREIVLHTAHHFNWVNLGGAIKHPDEGKRIDLSDDTNKNAEINDASVTLYPTSGYGNPDLIRQMIKHEKPDAIMLITDPRYFTWLFAMENEIRKHIPIAYLNIWDDYPAPMYNKAYYEACDLLMGISKQTVNINKLVLGDKAKSKVIRYVPHGLNTKYLFPIYENSPEWNEFMNFRKQLFGGKEFEFVVFFNSRNIRRKQIPDTMLAYRWFMDQLTPEQAKKCAFVLHTEVTSEHGTDLEAVRELLLDEPHHNVYFSTSKLDIRQMNFMYNIADVQIQLTSNEGWGLSLTEAMLTGTPIIANVTGGMQDQMRFVNEKKEWIDFDSEFPSNHTGKYTECGDWAFPVFPKTRNMVGSVPTPYIWDDHCDAVDAGKQLMEVYMEGITGRTERGLKGREWAISDEAGFTSFHQGERVMEAFTTLFNTWKPREKFEFINATKHEDNKLNHKLFY